MFLMIPVGVDYGARRYPMVTFTLMGICTAIYVVTLAFALGNGSSVYPWVFAHLWLIPAQSLWWTYLTSMFVHGGFLHLLGNMIYLFLFGSCVEDIIGRARFLVFYLICGLVGNFAYIAMTPLHFSSEVPLGGASGAISGCIGGFLLLLLRTKIEFKWIFFFFFRIWNGEFSLAAWIVISAWFLKDLLGAVIAGASHHKGGGVAFGAHVGGTLCGLGLIAVEKLRLKDNRTAPRELSGVQSSRAPAAPEVAEAADIFLYVDGGQIGPFTLSQVRGMFSTGAISTEAVYWKEGMESWRSGSELLEGPGSA
jgi:membrane associated rhomboid family serine protease